LETLLTSVGEQLAIRLFIYLFARWRL